MKANKETVRIFGIVLAGLAVVFIAERVIGWLILSSFPFRPRIPGWDGGAMAEDVAVLKDMLDKKSQHNSLHHSDLGSLLDKAGIDSFEQAGDKVVDKFSKKEISLDYSINGYGLAFHEVTASECGRLTFGFFGMGVVRASQGKGWLRSVEIGKHVLTMRVERDGSVLRTIPPSLDEINKVCVEERVPMILVWRGL